MKIAISAVGGSPDSPMDARFGRAGYFQVFVAGQGVSVLITGHCGPKAFKVLNAAGVKVMLCGGGTVESAVDKYKSGGLKEAAGPDVNGHWG